jgi:hypothetical protein
MNLDEMRRQMLCQRLNLAADFMKIELDSVDEDLRLWSMAEDITADFLEWRLQTLREVCKKRFEDIEKNLAFLGWVTVDYSVSPDELIQACQFDHIEFRDRNDEDENFLTELYKSRLEERTDDILVVPVTVELLRRGTGPFGATKIQSAVEEIDTTLHRHGLRIATTREMLAYTLQQRTMTHTLPDLFSTVERDDAGQFIWTSIDYRNFGERTPNGNLAVKYYDGSDGASLARGQRILAVHTDPNSPTYISDNVVLRAEEDNRPWK